MKKYLIFNKYSKIIIEIDRQILKNHKVKNKYFNMEKLKYKFLHKQNSVN